jgi:hypothetical protein
MPLGRGPQIETPERLILAPGVVRMAAMPLPLRMHDKTHTSKVLREAPQRINMWRVVPLKNKERWRRAEVQQHTHQASGTVPVK